MNPTKFQSHVQTQVKQGKSILLVAPTGLGKTFAVTGDLQDKFCKTIYAVPLRALGGGIRDAIQKLTRNGHIINPVIHHGDIQESQLFSEEFIVTTYDQVVCGVPGLPLSLPLKAGHAVAGAILMSRLILDEVHLAWGISDQALAILLAIIDFRRKLGLQTVVVTATLPTVIANRISEQLGLELTIVGKDNMVDDEALALREANRQLAISTLALKGKGETKQLDYSPLDEKLITARGKRIYFANTVERLQQTYDRLVAAGLQAEKITVLHNRMPRSWRTKVEKEVHERFGKGSPDSDRVLLATQVVEAGMDISAPLVISDPAAVDTLIQRAGRCARWFRKGIARGDFLVLGVPNAQLREWALPYREALVGATLKTIPEGQMSWSMEREWVDKAWGIGLDQQGKLPKDTSRKQEEQLEQSLSATTFALNLFDRAAQEQKQGEIANVFREILSVEVAVEEGNCVYLDDLAKRDLPALLAEGQHPETSSISLGRAWALLREAEGKAAVIRFDNDHLILHPADYIQLGDILIVPSTIAYLHPVKGLCFGDGASVSDAILSSGWLKKEKVAPPHAPGRRQTLFDHTSKVMDSAYRRLNEPGAYRHTLIAILKSIEPEKDVDQLANLIAEFARVAAGFHDLGKADRRWQVRAHEIDPECPSELIGRTLRPSEQIGIPHTPASYAATIKAAKLLVGDLPSMAEHLIRAIALATARHHSSLLNPATVKHVFQPHTDTTAFVREVLALVKAPPGVLEKAQDVTTAAKMGLTPDQVPLMLPNDDLFPIYALVGRAILLADREDARGEEIEQWRFSQ
jgi:CRISPR-associated endonuclease/helicase Cas3